MARERTFQYDYIDLQKLTGMKPKAIYQHTTRGNLDPSSLENVIIWVCRHGTKEFRAKMIDYALARKGELPEEPLARQPRTRRVKPQAAK